MPCHRRQDTEHRQPQRLVGAETLPLPQRLLYRASLLPQSLERLPRLLLSGLGVLAQALRQLAQRGPTALDINQPVSSR